MDVRQTRASLLTFVMRRLIECTARYKRWTAGDDETDTWIRETDVRLNLTSAA